MTIRPPNQVIDPAAVVSYLQERELLDEEEVCSVRELSGGVSSIVISVEAPGRSFVVKRSLPRLRVEADWRAKPERVLIEAAGLELASALTPGRVPRVLDVDETGFIIVIERAPASWRSWKEQLFDGVATVECARDLGTTLGTWHRQTADDASLCSPFADDETFVNLRVEPFYLTVASQHEDLARPIAALLERMSSQRSCFVHGDFSPKNVLVGDGGLWILDFEVAHTGDPVFDVAFMLHHLTLKTIHTGAVERIAALAAAFRGGYRDTAGGSTLDDVDYLGAHIGCLLVARVDGKSPADYLTTAGRQAARDEGIRLLSGLPGTYERLWRE